jgi:hypothetical protein
MRRRDCNLPLIFLDKRDHIICEDEGSQVLNCSGLGEVIDIVRAQIKPKTTGIDVCPTLTLTVTNKTFVKPSSCKFNTNVFKQVKSKCEGRVWCSLSVKSVHDGRCPKESKYLIISYKCIQRSNGINAG